MRVVSYQIRITHHDHPPARHTLCVPQIVIALSGSTQEPDGLGVRKKRNALPAFPASLLLATVTQGGITTIASDNLLIFHEFRFYSVPVFNRHRLLRAPFAVFLLNFIG
jgi:hypothetical protein